MIRECPARNETDTSMHTFLVGHGGVTVMQKQKRNVQRAQSGAIMQLAVHTVVSLAGGIAAAALLFSGLAALRCKVDIMPQLLSPISTAALSLAVLLAGLFLAALRKEKGLLYGLLIGIIFYAILWIAALARGQIEFSSLSVIKGTALLCSGAIGGSLGILMRERRRRIR